MKHDQRSGRDLPESEEEFRSLWQPDEKRPGSDTDIRGVAFTRCRACQAPFTDAIVADAAAWRLTQIDGRCSPCRAAGAGD